MPSGKRKRQRHDNKKSLKGLRYQAKGVRIWNKFQHSLKANPDLEFNAEFIKKHFNVESSTIERLVKDYNEFIAEQET